MSISKTNSLLVPFGRSMKTPHHRLFLCVVTYSLSHTLHFTLHDIHHSFQLQPIDYLFPVLIMKDTKEQVCVVWQCLGISAQPLVM